MGAFAENRKALGIGYALDCWRAEQQYKMNTKRFNKESERILKKISRQQADNNDDSSEEDDDTDDLMFITSKMKKRTTELLKKTKADSEAEPEKFEIIPSVGALNDKDLKNNLESACKILSDLKENQVVFTILGLLYAANIVRTEQVYQYFNKSTEADIEFMNGLMDKLGCPSFNPSYKAATDAISDEDLERIFDLESLFVDTDQWVFQELARKIKGDVIEEVPADESGNNTSATEEPKDEKEPVIPVSFNIPPIITAAAEDIPKITKREINMLESKFGDLLKGYNYQFNKIYDMYELVIIREDFGYDPYTIDPGHIFGNGVSIVLSLYGSIFPISLEYPDIVAKILENKNCFIYLNQKDKTKLFSKLLPDFRIYQNIDMSRGDIFKKINRDQSIALQNNLAFIFNLPWGISDDLPNPMPRMRFSKFINEDNFELVSDNKVKVVSLAGFNGSIKPMYIKMDKNTLKLKGDGVNLELTDIKG